MEIDGIQMSPCIVAKVRLALYQPSNRPGNVKICSQDYWDKIVDKFAAIDTNLNLQQIQRAKRRIDLFR